MRFSAVLNLNEEDCMTAYGYKRNTWRIILTWICVACTGGLLGVVFYWRKDWYIKVTSSRCFVDDVADFVILQDKYNEIFVSRVYEMSKYTRFYSKLPRGSILNNQSLIAPTPEKYSGSFVPVSTLKYFDCKRVRYIWNPAVFAYEKLIGISKVSLDYFDGCEGLDDICRSQRLRLFGLNVIAIKVHPILRILLKEAATPFYAFQLFSIILWFLDEYYPYTGAIIVITLFSLALETYETHRQEKYLHDRVQNHDVVRIQKKDGSSPRSSLLSLAFQTYVTRRQQRYFHNRVQDHDIVRIQKKDGSSHMVSSETLVPGDIILIENNGGKVVCDAVLISGSCIVNESSLTGESVPVPKVLIASSEKEQNFDVSSHNRSVLFCGTKILQARAGSDGTIRAVVIRTGYMTSKGELIRSIMFFRRVDFKFQNQTFWYIFALSCIGMIGMIYSIVISVAGNDDQRRTSSDTVLYTLDLITIIIPPALPAALTAGVVFSQRRLKGHSIFCISPRTINMSGLINLVCFDKTGTLTEDGLDVKEVLPVQKDKQHEYRYFTSRDPLFCAMSTCHSLSLMQTETGETIIGDPLDLNMFQRTNWELIEERVEGFGQTIYRIIRASSTDKEEEGQLVIFREFPFASAFQRMGVIIFNSVSHHFEFYVKGATEKVLELCDTKTVPNDCLTRLEDYSSEGNRVIALAWKDLGELDLNSASKLSRSQAEKDLQFVGLIVFENRIKVDSPAVIEELNQANFRTVMLTGDNLHTAISVARTCGIIRPYDRVSIVQADEDEVTFTPAHHMTLNEGSSNTEFYRSDSTNKLDVEAVEMSSVAALSGDTLANIKKFHPNALPRIVLQGTVFARVSPLDKQYMIEQFQEVGYQVAMCGDGANDCGALRAAHTGISLSESEAAAAAPFISTNQSISCVLQVLREGRCALVTFFGIFFLMALYSMCQFISVILLYWFGEDFSNAEFTYEDLFELTILGIVLAMTLPYHKLTKDHVPSSLKSFSAIFSLIGHTILLLASQVIAFELAQSIPCNMEWNNTYGTTHNSVNATNNATVGSLTVDCLAYGVFPLGTLQIIILSFLFSIGPPFRKPFWTNYFHAVVAIPMIIFDLVLMVGPTVEILWLIGMNATDRPDLRFSFLGILFGYLVSAVFFEKVILNIGVARCLDKRMFRRLRDPRREDIEEDLRRKVIDSYASKSLSYKNLAFIAD